jgi:hypothetical protein
MQSIPNFYSLDTMTIPEWFKLLANEESQQNEEEEKQQEIDGTYVYEVQTDQHLVLANEVDLSPGIYYMRTSEDNASKIQFCHVRKLSFSEIVFLSDIFTTVVTSLIPDPQEMKDIADKGESSKYFTEEMNSIPCKGLEVMRERAWKKYFDKDLGLMAYVRRFFSAIANFFLKYNQFVDTGIYWPGNSCRYADQVVDQINRIKRVYIRQAYEASKEILCDRLGILPEEVEQKDFETMRLIYRKKILQVHPDKNKDPNANDQFNKVNRAWGDFGQLHKLKDEFKVDQYEETDFYDLEEKDEDEDELSAKSSSVTSPLARYDFKRLNPYLALPAPIAVAG